MSMLVVGAQELAPAEREALLDTLQKMKDPKDVSRKVVYQDAVKTIAQQTFMQCGQDAMPQDRAREQQRFFEVTLSIDAYIRKNPNATPKDIREELKKYLEEGEAEVGKAQEGVRS